MPRITRHRARNFRIWNNPDNFPTIPTTTTHTRSKKKKIYTKFFESRISRNQIIIQAAYRTFGKSKKDQKKKKTVKVPVKVPEAQSLTWCTQSRITQQTKSFLYIYIYKNFCQDIWRIRSGRWLRGWLREI